VWIGLTSPALAQIADAKAEARDHFDRGLRLFNQLDNDGALAEFTRAQELVPHPMALYNIGLVYAAMGRPVQAVDTFDRILSAPTGLDAAAVERVRMERQRQLGQIAELEVTTAVPNAIVEVDGIEAGRTPLKAPLRIARGTHVVGVVAAGYTPLRKQLNLLGGARTATQFDLVASDAALSHVDVRSQIPGLELYLDGEFIGLTPLPTSVVMLPGPHWIEGRRPGYRTVRQSINLGPGSTGALNVNPEIDERSLATQAGELSLTISEPGAVVFIDGEARGAYKGPLQLVSGLHLLRVEHADFFSVERKVSVPARGRSELAIDLRPTPDKLERYRSATARRSAWGWTTTASGALLVAGSAGFLWYNDGQKSEKESAFDAQVARSEPGEDCDPQGIQAATCRTELQIALDDLERTRQRDVYGWVGLGVGAAALAVGLYLLLGNDDPDRYAPKPLSDVYARRRPIPIVWATNRSNGATLQLSF